MAEFCMPSLGADMTEGALLEWRVHPGDQVHKGDIVAVVDTTKAAVEVESFDTGVVDRLLVDEGTWVSVGTPLATIRTAPEAPIRPPSKRRAKAKRVEPTVRPSAAAAPSPPSEPALHHDHLITSPLARQMAEKYHVDLESVHGTGFGGRITRADIERAAAEHAVPASAKAPPTGRLRISPLARRLAAELGVDANTVIGSGHDGAIGAEDIRKASARAIAAPEVEPATEVGARPTAAQPAERTAESSLPDRAAMMRTTIAATMTRAKREIPHYYLTHTIDLSAAMAWLHDRNLELPVAKRLVPAALLLKAAARAATAVPQLNGFWIDGHYEPGPGVHLGVAVSLRGGGLIAPAIHNADELDLETLMANTVDLVSRARAGRLRGPELTDGTITVSNLGDQGVESIIGVINPPQVALVGFGTIVDRPWAVNGLLGVRPVVTVSLSGDHRATDGVIGARYLKTIEQLLQQPEEL